MCNYLRPIFVKVNNVTGNVALYSPSYKTHAQNEVKVYIHILGSYTGLPGSNWKIVNGYFRQKMWIDFYLNGIFIIAKVGNFI